MVVLKGFAVGAAVALLATGAIARVEAQSLAHVTVHGIEIYAAHPPKGVHFDVPLVGEKAALVTLRNAVDALMAGSPLSARAVERLKANGRVEVIYDPGFPKEQKTTFEVAAYYPHFYDPDGAGGRDFLVVVGRHGVKWPTRELAAVLAHELAGHGMQRLRGTFESMRELDRECEAQLYQEQTLQDLRVNKLSHLMVRFRQDLEQRYCSDFRHFQARRQPATLKLWDARNPNVPRLLASFRTYLGTRLAQARAAPSRGEARRESASR